MAWNHKGCRRDVTCVWKMSKAINIVTGRRIVIRCVVGKAIWCGYNRFSSRGRTVYIIYTDILCCCHLVNVSKKYSTSGQVIEQLQKYFHSSGNTPRSNPMKVPNFAGKIWGYFCMNITINMVNVYFPIRNSPAYWTKRWYYEKTYHQHRTEHQFQGITMVFLNSETHQGNIDFNQRQLSRSFGQKILANTYHRPGN